jgi:hypothetical protein
MGKGLGRGMEEEINNLAEDLTKGLVGLPARYDSLIKITLELMMINNRLNDKGRGNSVVDFLVPIFFQWNHSSQESPSKLCTWTLLCNSDLMVTLNSQLNIVLFYL